MRRKTNVLRKRIVFIIIFIVIVELLLGAVVFFLIPDRYEATVTLLVITSDSDLSNSRYDLNTKLLEDYRVMCYSDAVLENALKNANSDVGIEELRMRTIVTSVKSTNVMTITVWMNRPESAALHANSIASAITDEVQSKLGFDNLQIIDAARAPSNPARIQSALILLIGFVASAIIACITALIVDYFDDTIRSTEQAASLFGRPVIGQIPHGVTRLRKR